MIKKCKQVKSIDELFNTTADQFVVYDENVIFKCDDGFIYNLESINTNRMEGASIAQINRWIKDEFIDSVNLYRLVNPYIVGGRIFRREGFYHEEGQLLLTNDLKLIKPSFGVMDGHPSLPIKIIKGYEKGEIENIILDEEMINEYEYKKGWYYFVGNSHRHFGHFFLEALPRLWAFQYLPNYLKNKIQFVVYENDLKPFMFEFFSLFGINRDRIISAKGTIVAENLIVPDLPYRTHKWISKLFFNHINKIKNHVTAGRKNRKIFLSRSGVPDRPLVNRNYLENYFKMHNYEIIRPEKMSIYEQIKTIMESDSIAGEVGSQMYLSAFAECNTKLHIFAPKNFYLKDDCLLSKISNVDLRVLLGSAIDFNVAKDQRSWEIDEKLFLEFMNC